MATTLFRIPGPSMHVISYMDHCTNNPPFLVHMLLYIYENSYKRTTFHNPSATNNLSTAVWCSPLHPYIRRLDVSQPHAHAICLTFIKGQAHHSARGGTNNAPTSCDFLKLQRTDLWSNQHHIYPVEYRIVYHMCVVRYLTELRCSTLRAENGGLRSFITYHLSQPT